MLPSSVFEELENSKSMLDAVVNYQIVQQLRICAQNEEGSKEPAVTESSLFDVARVHSILRHHTVALCDFLRPLPLNSWLVHSILRWIHWIIIQ